MDGPFEGLAGQSDGRTDADGGRCKKDTSSGRDDDGGPTLTPLPFAFSPLPDPRKLATKMLLCLCSHATALCPFVGASNLKKMVEKDSEWKKYFFSCRQSLFFGHLWKGLGIKVPSPSFVRWNQFTASHSILNANLIAKAEPSEVGWFSSPSIIVSRVNERSSP